MGLFKLLLLLSCMCVQQMRLCVKERGGPASQAVDMGYFLFFSLYGVTIVTLVVFRKTGQIDFRRSHLPLVGRKRDENQYQITSLNCNQLG